MELGEKIVIFYLPYIHILRKAKHKCEGGYYILNLYTTST